jgi:hypothetical protein
MGIHEITARAKVDAAEEIKAWHTAVKDRVGTLLLRIGMVIENASLLSIMKGYEKSCSGSFMT